MKGFLKVIAGVFILLMAVMVTSAVAGPIPQGDTQVTLIDKLTLKIGLQY